MKNITNPIYWLSLAVTAMLLIAVQSGHGEEKQVMIALAGDSTVADYPKLERDLTGWGTPLVAAVKDSAVVMNFGIGGRSSRSFRAEGHWDKVLAAKPDWVVIQFGQNDLKGKGPERESDPDTDYRDHLRQYITEARAIGAKPVLVTPICRRNFLKNGSLHDKLAPYAEAVKAVAAEMNVPYLDLHNHSYGEYTTMGPEAAARLSPSEDPTDEVHFSRKAAVLIGSWVLLLMREQTPELAQYFQPLEVPQIAGGATE